MLKSCEFRAFRTVISEEALLWKLRKLPRHGVTCLIAYSRGKPRLSHKLQDPMLLLFGEHYFGNLTAPCKALMRSVSGHEQLTVVCECFSICFSGVTEAFRSLPARPVEFVLLGHTPSLPFTVFDVAAISTIYSMMLNRGLTRDFVRVHLKESLGDKWKVNT